VIAGYLLILFSAFSNFSSQAEFIDYSENTREISTVGLNHPAWYLFLICTSILFGIGYFTGHIVAKIAFYILLPIFTATSFFFAVLLTVTWGATPFSPQYEFGFAMEIVGCLLVLIATIVSMHRHKKKQPQKIQETSLIDRD
jgi:predicted membrane protein